MKRKYFDVDQGVEYEYPENSSSQLQSIPVQFNDDTIPVQLTNLPVELKDMIAENLSYEDLGSLGQINPEWRAITNPKRQRIVQKSCFHSSYLLSDDMSVNDDLEQLEEMSDTDNFVGRTVKNVETTINGGTFFVTYDNDYEILYSSWFSGNLYEPIEDYNPKGEFQHDQRKFNALIKMFPKFPKHVIAQTLSKCRFRRDHPNMYNPFLSAMFLNQRDMEKSFSVVTFDYSGTVQVQPSISDYFSTYLTIVGDGQSTLFPGVADEDLLYFCQSLFYTVHWNFLTGKESEFENWDIFFGKLTTPMECEGTRQGALQTLVPVILVDTESITSHDFRSSSRIIKICITILNHIYGKSMDDIAENDEIPTDILRHDNYPKTVLYLVAMLASYNAPIHLPQEIYEMTLSDEDVLRISIGIEEYINEGTEDGIIPTLNFVDWYYSDDLFS